MGVGEDKEHLQEGVDILRDSDEDRATDMVMMIASTQPPANEVFVIVLQRCDGSWSNS